jgi:formylglycine-generating enzyme required for sulfatase activity
MAAIPGGTFFMGTDTGEPTEQPQHAVKVDAFCMDITEVTVSAYGACKTCSAPAREVEYPDLKDAERAIWSPSCNANHPERGDHPVNCVDWDQASAYCKSVGKRLPTEAEWEYAARGGDAQRTYPWGEDAPTPKLLNGCGTECVQMLAGRGQEWTAMYDEDDGFPETAPVGSFPAGASRWGVQDLAGNVWEWVSNHYCPYPQEDCAEPKRDDRGGGWGDGNTSSARGAHRQGCLPSQRVHNLGFRCVK